MYRACWNNEYRQRYEQAIRPSKVSTKARVDRSIKAHSYIATEARETRNITSRRLTSWYFRHFDKINRIYAFKHSSCTAYRHCSSTNYRYDDATRNQQSFSVSELTADWRSYTALPQSIIQTSSWQLTRISSQNVGMKSPMLNSKKLTTNSQSLLFLRCHIILASG